jgi:hypothetical protein
VGDNEVVNINLVLSEVLYNYGGSSSISLNEEPPCLVIEFVEVFPILQVNGIIILGVWVVLPPLKNE